MSDSPYGEKDYSIKPNKKIIKVDSDADDDVFEDMLEIGEVPELDYDPIDKDIQKTHDVMIDRRPEEGGSRFEIPKGPFGVSQSVASNDGELESLRELAKSLFPKHGDKLYPLEVLGAYKRVQDHTWQYFGNPEQFIDYRLKKFIAESDPDKIRNRLERELAQNPMIRKAFKLRLNYAYLLEEGKDTITINRTQAGYLTFTDALDEEGNYIGKHESSEEIRENGELDRLQESFYSKSEEIASQNTGTPINIRDKIKFMMDQAGMELEEDLDLVYNELRRFNKVHLEDGLVSRIAYLIFISEDGYHIT